MIEYILNTGSLFDSSFYHQRGSVGGGIGFIGENSPLTTEVSINGRVLLETLPSISVVAQTEIIQNSGDFFLSGFSLRETTGFLDLLNLTNLKYDKINSGSHKFYESNDYNSLITGFSGIIGNTLSGDYVFLNGIRLISGETYRETDHNFIWTNNLTGVTGMLFTMPKRQHDYYSGAYDLKRPLFNAGTSIGWLNGVKIDNSEILETASIVSCIETGIAPVKFFTGETTDTIIF